MKLGIRKLKTTQELRMIYPTLEQGVKVRPKRMKNILPHSFWDYWHYKNRSWKKYRKNQFKG